MYVHFSNMSQFRFPVLLNRNTFVASCITVYLATRNDAELKPHEGNSVDIICGMMICIINIGLRGIHIRLIGWLIALCVVQEDAQIIRWCDHYRIACKHLCLECITMIITYSYWGFERD